MLDGLLTRWTRAGANETDPRMIGKTVADDDAWESFFRQLDAGVSCVGSGAQDGGANPLARHKLRRRFTGPAIFVNRQNDQIEIGFGNRLAHAFEDRDVIWRCQRATAGVGQRDVIRERAPRASVAEAVGGFEHALAAVGADRA